MGVQLIAPLKSLPLSVSKRFMAICRTKERLLRKKNQFNGADNNGIVFFSSDQLSSVAKFCPAVCDPMDCSAPGFPVYHQLPELTQTHALWVGDAIQPSHPLLSPFPPTFNPSQHQGLFEWVSSSHQVTKVLELQLRHQSFQRIFRTDFL